MESLIKKYWYFGFVKKSVQEDFNIVSTRLVTFRDFLKIILTAVLLSSIFFKTYLKTFYILPDSFKTIWVFIYDF